jgi:apolipoprotein N-acyltransferase
MDKEKISNGIMWVSMAVLFLFTSAITLWINFKKESLLLYILTAIFICCLFFFAYKGISSILDAFFKHKKNETKN